MTQPGPFTEDLFNNPERPQTSAYVANNLISRALGKVSNDVHQKVKMDYHQKVTALQDRKRRQQQIFEELQQQEDFYEADLMDTDVIEKKICVTNIVDPVNFWAHIGTGRIPPQGYRKQRNYSHSSMGWLTWRETEMKVEMRHAWHPLGEKYLHDAHVWADGYVEETKLVLNYAGCMYHATEIAQIEEDEKQIHAYGLKKLLEPSDMPNSIGTGQIIFAKSTCGKILRAEVVLVDMDGASIEVNFMDLGCKELVHYSDIVWKIPRRLKATSRMPCKSKHCRLTDIVPIISDYTSTWSDAAIEYFTNSVLAQTLDVTIVNGSSAVNICEVDIFIEDGKSGLTSLSNQMVQSLYAAHLHLSEPTKIIPADFNLNLFNDGDASETEEQIDIEHQIWKEVNHVTDDIPCYEPSDKEIASGTYHPTDTSDMIRTVCAEIDSNSNTDTDDHCGTSGKPRPRLGFGQALRPQIQFSPTIGLQPAVIGPRPARIAAPIGPPPSRGLAPLGSISRLKNTDAGFGQDQSLRIRHATPEVEKWTRGIQTEVPTIDASTSTDDLAPIDLNDLYRMLNEVAQNLPGSVMTNINNTAKRIATGDNVDTTGGQLNDIEEEYTYCTAPPQESEEESCLPGIRCPKSLGEQQSNSSTPNRRIKERYNNGSYQFNNSGPRSRRDDKHKYGDGRDRSDSRRHDYSGLNEKRSSAPHFKNRKDFKECATYDCKSDAKSNKHGYSTEPESNITTSKEPSVCSPRKVSSKGIIGANRIGKGRGDGIK